MLKSSEGAKGTWIYSSDVGIENKLLEYLNIELFHLLFVPNLFWEQTEMGTTLYLDVPSEIFLVLREDAYIHVPYFMRVYN